MSDILSLKDAAPVIEETLLSGGRVKLIAAGRSMEPVIVNGQDVVIIVKAQNPLKKDDIVLFKRNNGNLVLHRIIALDDNRVTLRGDSQWTTETVDKSRVMGILEAIERNGKIIPAESIYFKKYNVILPAVRWNRRIINSIKIRLGANR